MKEILVAKVKSTKTNIRIQTRRIRITTYPPSVGTVEFVKAGERIMKYLSRYHRVRPAAALAWALEFVQEDAQDYWDGKLSERWQEVLRFCHDGGMEPIDDPRFYRLNVTDGRALPGQEERTLLRDLQDEWLTKVKCYHTKGETSGDMALTVTVRKSLPGAATVEAKIPQAFRYHMVHLLRDMGPSIQQCPGFKAVGVKCGLLWLASRDKQKWHPGSSCQAVTYKLEHPKNKRNKPTKKKPKPLQPQKGGHSTRRTP